MSAHSAAAILQTLDEAARSDGLPMLDGGSRVLAMRLQAYRDAEQWALVFNTIEWSGDRLTARIHPLGSARRMRTWMDHLHAHPEVMRQSERDMLRMVELFERAPQECSPEAVQSFMASAGHGVKALAEEYHANAAGDVPTEDDAFIGSSEFECDDQGEVVGVRVRGQAVALADLDPSAWINEPAVVHEPELALALALIARWREALFATESEIARFYSSALPSPMLVLDDWRHPDLASDGPPSALATFRTLAEAMASGDASRYAPGDERPNTDWRLWEPV